MEKDKQYWIEKFEAFLKENNCYEEFEQNVLTLNGGEWKTIIEFYNDCRLEDMYFFVCSGFPFYSTSNRDFWSELDNKWQEIFNSES